MKHSALGMIETYGYIAALAGADAAVKAAVVSIDHLEIVKGGIVTVFFRGDVGAVKAAVEAGEQESRRVGNFRRSHVIARVSEDVEAMLVAKPPKEAPPVAEVKLEPEIIIEAEPIIKSEPMPEAEPAPQPQPLPKVTLPLRRSKEELLRMKVVKLRNIARSIEDIDIERNRIKFANKEDLVNAILASYERG
jgi:microcompartment protein CcmL/EutN